MNAIGIGSWYNYTSKDSRSFFFRQAKKFASNFKINKDVISIVSTYLPFFTFSYLCNGRESIILGQMEILMDLQVVRSPEFENPIFSVWCVCMCVCMSLCVCLRAFYKHNSKKLQKKQHIRYSTFVSYTGAN